MKAIADEILELRALPTPELVERYTAAFGCAPRVRHREWLWKRVAWRLQEERLGGLSSVAKHRLEELIEAIDLPLNERTRTVTGRRVSPQRAKTTGTLTRMWRGREVRAIPVDGGFDVDGVLYKSLSAAARGITGTQWNGRLFFGLVDRKRAQ